MSRAAIPGKRFVNFVRLRGGSGHTAKAQPHQRPCDHSCTMTRIRFAGFLLAPLLCVGQSGLTSPDMYKLRSVGEVQLSPDGSRVAYAVTNNDQPGRPYSQTFVHEARVAPVH